METLQITVSYPYKGSKKDRILDSLKSSLSFFIIFIALFFAAFEFYPDNDSIDWDPHANYFIPTIISIVSLVFLLGAFIIPFIKRENKGIKSFQITIDFNNFKTVDLKIEKKNGQSSSFQLLLKNIQIEKRYYRFVGFKNNYVIPMKILSDYQEQALISYINDFKIKKEYDKKKKDNNNDDE